MSDLPPPSYGESIKELSGPPSSREEDRQRLLERKNIAVETEDYDLAKELKAQLEVAKPTFEAASVLPPLNLLIHRTGFRPGFKSGFCHCFPACFPEA